MRTAQGQATRAMSWVHQAARQLGDGNLLREWQRGRGSAEVTFNSAELESWDLWSYCLRPWNDLGMIISDKSNCSPWSLPSGIAHHSPASQSSCLCHLGSNISLSITAPHSQLRSQSYMQSTPRPALPHSHLSLDMLLRTSRV